MLVTENRWIRIIINISQIWEFFRLALADSFPLDTEWKQVFSSLQDSS